MSISFAKLEQTVFRSLNGIVEPAVRMGIGSPRFTPASLIVLETTGFKSGQQRRTPLWSVRLGPYRIVSTGRGERSFWVKNLRKDSKVSYWVGGKRRESNALVIAQNDQPADSETLTPFLRKVTDLISRYAREGWAFAILTPEKG